MIIGLVGFIGSGKGTAGELIEQKGFVRDSFAKPLKDACSIIFGWPRSMVEGDSEVSRKWREEKDIYWSEKFGYDFSPRLALQLMGTEAGRDVFHKDLWIISLINRSKGKNVVVTDVRFKNEIDYIQKNGGIVVRIKRGEDPPWYEVLQNTEREGEKEELMNFVGVHRSEWDWVGCEFDYVIENNGTVQDLGKKIDDILTFIR